MSDTSPSVLIVRLDAIGDAVAAVPLLQALAAKGVVPAVVLGPHSAGVLRATAHPIVAAFAQREDSAKNRAAIRRFAGSLRQNRYDCALIASEDPAAYRLARDAGIPTRIGFENGMGKPLKTLWVRAMCTQTVYRSAGLDPAAPHKCEVLFKLAAPLLGRTIPSRNAAELRSFLVEGAATPDPRVLMQITDKWQRLGARDDDVAQLARRITDLAPARFVGAHTERRAVERFTAQTGIAVETFEDVAPWKEAIAAAKAVVAPDSGAIHLSGMTGVRTVAVYAAPRFELQSARWAPWASPYRAIKMTGAWPTAAADALGELLESGSVHPLSR